VYHPCFRAFSFPFGAPGDGPPCIRQRPFGIAGDWHGLPLRVFAPQRGLDCMSKSMGLSLDFGRWGYPRRLVDVADNGIVRVDGDVLDGDLLLSRAAMAIEPYTLLEDFVERHDHRDRAQLRLV
jgi:hypothetical protein